jgi:hypothetical protein
MKFAITLEILIFVDADEHASRVLPALQEIMANRLIVRENVVLEQRNLN